MWSNCSVHMLILLKSCLASRMVSTRPKCCVVLLLYHSIGMYNQHYVLQINLYQLTCISYSIVPQLISTVMQRDLRRPSKDAKHQWFRNTFLMRTRWDRRHRRRQAHWRVNRLWKFALRQHPCLACLWKIKCTSNCCNWNAISCSIRIHNLLIKHWNATKHHELLKLCRCKLNSFAVFLRARPHLSWVKM